jgi:hypothetical protein
MERSVVRFGACFGPCFGRSFRCLLAIVGDCSVLVLLPSRTDYQIGTTEMKVHLGPL